ncbi:unannotated protein [freshwater metagenome]|uniref:Unannotated protein n=1 Tax=freshwater metagenome TaxID=449393 RepID=A0A6J7IYZ0_9ZZZZ
MTTSSDSRERGDQQIKMTGLVFDSGRISLDKFVAVTSIPGIVVGTSTFGLPSELRSTALAKFAGIFGGTGTGTSSQITRRKY